MATSITPDLQEMIVGCKQRCPKNVLDRMISSGTAPTIQGWINGVTNCQQQCEEPIYISNPEIIYDANTSTMFQANQRSLQRNLFPWTNEVLYFDPRASFTPDCIVTDAEILPSNQGVPPETRDARTLIRIYGGVNGSHYANSPLVPGAIVGTYNTELPARSLQYHLKRIGIPTMIQTDTYGARLVVTLRITQPGLRYSFPVEW